jgi:hypothetical protein
LPDLFSARRIILDELRTVEGDHFQLFQEWVGDGYLTELVHTNAMGRAWWFTIEGDADKAWRGAIQRTEPRTLVIKVLQETFYYQIDTKAVADRQGNSQWLLEIPEDGGEAFLVRRVFTDKHE